MGKMRSLSTSFQHMNRVLHREDAAGLSDAELVCRFVEHRDEMAFSTLVWRYGVIVLGVCRRVLRHEQDAEDAFQATFLILAQKAVSIRRPEELANWLYGVAYNVARKAKAYRQRREIKEHTAAAQQPSAVNVGMWNDLQEILDHELCALTDKYRTPIVLCDIRGLTIQEAAAELGCPPKTLGTRLSRGRSMLAGRLTRRGVVVSVGALATAITSCATGAATAAIPPRLLDVTIHAAIGFATDSAVAISPKVTALTKGVSNIMVLKSLKYVGVMACCVLISSGLVRHFSAQAGTMPTAQSRELSGQGTPAQAKRVNTPKPFNHRDHIHKLIEHLLDWTGIGRGEVEDSAIASTDDKEKPILSGVWERKDGDIEFKLDFSTKEVLKILLHHGDKEGTVTCECTADKDGIVKGKITQVEGVDHLKEKLPVGAEFKFKWKVMDKIAMLDDVESEKAPLLKHLEGKFDPKK